jgi:equilibrative nucleoside transporter 1/2/3
VENAAAPEGRRESESAPVDKWELLQRVAFNEFIVFVVFFSTLLLWPPLITEIKSFNYPLLQETQWWPLILLAVFSVSDCLGRLSLPFRFGLNVSNLWIAVLLRFALFPLLVCSAKGIYFTHDYFSVLFVFLLGFTNGYLGSLGILFINEQVTEEEKGVVGMFTGFFLNMGLVFGATGACFVEKLVLAA